MSRVDDANVPEDKRVYFDEFTFVPAGQSKRVTYYAMLKYQPMQYATKWVWFGEEAQRQVTIEGPVYYYAWTSPEANGYAVRFFDEDDKVLARLEDDGAGRGTHGPLAILPASEFAPVEDPYADMIQ